MKPYVDIKKAWATVLSSAKIDNFRFHDLRHTAITRMEEKGIPLLVVQEIAGHTKIERFLFKTNIKLVRKNIKRKSK